MKGTVSPTLGRRIHLPRTALVVEKHSAQKAAYKYYVPRWSNETLLTEEPYLTTVYRSDWRRIAPHINAAQEKRVLRSSTANHAQEKEAAQDYRLDSPLT